MKDPKRWRNLDGGADGETRALLLNPPATGPSRSEADQIWASLSAHLDVTFAPPGPDGSQIQHSPPSHAPGPQIGPAVAASGAGAVAGKVTLAVVLLATAGGVVGVRAISSRDRHDRMVAPKTAKAEPHLLPAASPIPPEPQMQPPAETTGSAIAPPESRWRPEKFARPRSAASTPSPIAPAVAPQPSLAEDRPPPAPAPIGHVVAEVAAPPTSAPVPVNELLEEGRRLDRARIALRAHDPDLALQLLGVGTAGTTTALAQEREALTIEAQAAKPALRAKATERARAFMQAYPNSPYRARIKAIVFEGE